MDRREKMSLRSEIQQRKMSHFDQERYLEMSYHIINKKVNVKYLLLNT